MVSVRRRGLFAARRLGPFAARRLGPFFVRCRGLPSIRRRRTSFARSGGLFIARRLGLVSVRRRGLFAARRLGPFFVRCHGLPSIRRRRTSFARSGGQLIVRRRGLLPIRRNGLLLARNLGPFSIRRGRPSLVRCRGSPIAPRLAASAPAAALVVTIVLRLRQRRRLGHGRGASNDEVADDRVAELEGARQLVECGVGALDVHEDVVRLVDLVDRVGELAPSPVFESVDRAAVRFDHRAIPLDHRRDLLALVGMDQEHHFVVSHRSLLAGLPPGCV